MPDADADAVEPAKKKVDAAAKKPADLADQPVVEAPAVQTLTSDNAPKEKPFWKLW